MKEPNSTVILNCRDRLIKNYLEKGLYMIERGTRQLILLPNDVILRINLNNQLDTIFVMAKIYAVSNTIKQLHIRIDMHVIYKQDLYKEKQKEIYVFFLEYIVPIMNDLDHLALIACVD